MKIPCPFCGARDSREFSYLGDATLQRPQAAEDFHDYVYLRDNPAGSHRELWYHGQGCRSWVVVERNTLDHSITGAALAREVRS